MIDLHTHTLFSDGVLLPSELVRRAAVAGYKAIALTDHVDASNIDLVVPRLATASKELDGKFGIRVVPGAELTHIPPEDMANLARKARSLGARLIVAHGETLSEPVAPGTNLAALESDIDILAHPGLITEEEVRLAVKRRIYLEVSGRKGHSLSNGHVVKQALMLGAALVLNSDAHEPGDLLSHDRARRVLLGAGWPEERLGEVFGHSAQLVEKSMSR
ncbi:MAG: histidinol phosphate phosphatase domain-containing protein [Nitrospirota bacterium]|nr:histidinol phosphate phosphatase domain-containing protein [Nitrospirota bacterium]